MASTWSRREVAARQVVLDAGAQLRQRAGEDDHVLELGLVAAGAPARVVEVLLAAALVDAGGLDVAAGIRADPHVLPRGRDHQLVDAGQDLGIVDALAVGVEDREAAAAPDPAQARAAAVDLPERGWPGGTAATYRGRAPRAARSRSRASPEGETAQPCGLLGRSSWAFLAPPWASPSVARLRLGLASSPSSSSPCARAPRRGSPSARS